MLKLIFAAFYCAQGMTSQFILALILQRMYEGEMSILEGGLTMAIQYLPWVLKPLWWGPVVDRAKRLRGPILLTSNLLMGAVILGFPWAQGVPGAILALVLLHDFVQTLQDVAVDGVAFEFFKDEEEQTALQRWLLWGGLVGSFVGGAGMLALLPTLGWELVCPLIAMLSIAVGCGPCLALMRRVRELPVEALRRSHLVKDFYREWRSVNGFGWFWAVRSLLKQRLQRGAAAWGGRTFALAVFVALFAFVATGFGNVLAGPLLSLTKSTRLPIATILVVNDLVKFPGAALGSWLTRMVGSKRATFLILLSLCFSFALFAFAKPWWTVPFVVTGLIGFSSFFEAAWKVRLFALFMRLTQSESKATQYSVFMAATNFSKSWAAAGAALLATTENVAVMYIVAVAAQLVILIPLRRLFRRLE